MAIKIIDFKKMNSANKKRILNEIRILASLNSPFVLKFLDSFFDTKKKNIWIVTEFLEGGDLLELLKRHQRRNLKFSEKLIWNFAVQILIGLEQMNHL